MRTTRLIAACLGVLLLIPATAGAAPKGDTHGHRTNYGNLTQTCERGTIEYDGPTEIWPPNHKMLQASLSFIPTEEDQTYLFSYGAGHDQVIDGEELNGSGNTDPSSDITVNGNQMGTDIRGEGTEVLPVEVRAERSGRDQSGRTYTISGVVTMTADDTMMETGFGDETAAEDDDASADGDNEICPFSFEITVPHDQGRGGPTGEEEPADATLLTLF